MDFIFTIGIFISLFQFVLLLNKKSKSLSDKILTLWMLVIAIHLTSYHLYQLGYWIKYPHLVGVTAPLPFLYGPFVYLYVSHSLKNQNGLSVKDYLHFLPVALSYLYLFKFFFFYSAEQKRMVDSGEINDFGIFSFVMLIGFVISGIAYSYFSYQQLNKYDSLLDDNLSNTDRVDLNWLKGLIWGVAVLFVFVAIMVVTRDIMGLQYTFNVDFILYSIIISGILLLGYFGIRHQNIFTDNIVVTVQSSGSYYKSGLKESDAHRIKNKLLLIMEEEKPYLEPKLSLSSLAEILQVSPNHLSQIINQSQSVNFNDFVNRYRVEEFIRLSSENKNYSLLAIALEAGFNSKSSFNKIFKKHKGMPPSQFLAQQKTNTPGSA